MSFREGVCGKSRSGIRLKDFSTNELLASDDLFPVKLWERREGPTLRTSNPTKVWVLGIDDSYTKEFT